MQIINEKGLKHICQFCPADKDPFDTVNWVKKDAEIKDEAGNLIFVQKDVEVPEQWSQLAVNIVASKYFYGDKDKGEREDSVRKLIYRVTRTIADWGKYDRYFYSDEDAENFYKDLTWLCLHQYGCFNSPVWFNCGLNQQYGVTNKNDNVAYAWNKEKKCVEKVDPYKYPQCSACYILSLEDTIDDIWRLAADSAKLFKYGSGVGTNWSNLRSSFEKLSGGGSAAGPCSFMKLQDTTGGVIKSGGRCLAPYQLVYTARGPIPVQNLALANKDFIVLSHDPVAGRFKAKTARAWRSGQKEVLRITTDKGVFDTSFDHPFMLADKKTLLANQLKPEMRLFNCAINERNPGYARVELKNGSKGKETLHRLIARDIICPNIDITGFAVHHIDDNKLNNIPENLAIITPSKHASIHNNEKIAQNRHIFQTARFVHAGIDNGMHKSGKFYNDPKKIADYSKKQSAALRRRGVAAEIQIESVKQRLLNLGYELINAGYCIDSLDKYLTAYKQVHGRIYSRIKQSASFTNLFGSYENYYLELSKNNHVVKSIESLGVMDVYSVEVDCPTPDDKTANSGHNYVIWPNDNPGPFGSGVVVFNTRRSAIMQILDIDHPDILEFLRGKAKEEKKAQALIKAGYAANFNGEAYSTVAFQNTNQSVRVSDKFMHAVLNDEDWITKLVSNKNLSGPKYKAKRLMHELSLGTYICGDCGVQCDDTIQKWHTCKNTAKIRGTNPCSEYVFLDDSACNLSSLNLCKFQYDTGRLKINQFIDAAKIFITAQEILVDNAGYPTEKVALNSHLYRPLGLGFANLGAFLLFAGIPYESDKARTISGLITAIMTGTAYFRSAEIASNIGAFEGFELNKDCMLDVIEMHFNAIEDINKNFDFSSETDAAYNIWQRTLDYGLKYGYRNAQTTVIAPVGTISFFMDCQTTGIEPELALVKYKNLAGGGVLKLVNQMVPSALRQLKYNEEEIDRIIKHIEQTGTIENCDTLADSDLSIFDCSFKPANGKRSIHWSGHVKMMAAIQPFISGALSKTINMPAESTVEDISNAYILGWKLGLKALAIYRDGSKGSQPLSTKLESEKKAEAPKEKIRRRLSATRASKTHTFTVAGHKGYITVGLYEDGTPGELFITMSKTGSTIDGLLDSIGASVSLGLQYGVPLDVFIKKFSHVRFEPAGMTGNKKIPIAKSIIDYVFRWLENIFVKKEEIDTKEVKSDLKITTTSDAPMCATCGMITTRQGSCYLCFNCGNSSGCG